MNQQKHYQTAEKLIVRESSALTKEETKDKSYDLILCSESFQYLLLEKSISKIKQYLNREGYLLICDFFKRDVPGKSPVRERIPSLTKLFPEKNCLFETQVSVRKTYV